MTRRLISHVLFALGLVFLFFPILVVVPMSFSADSFLGFPPRSWGLTWYRAYIEDPVWVAATWRSFRIGLASSLLATVTGTMSVIALPRLGNLTRVGMTGLFLAPAIVPNIIVALGVFILALYAGLAQSELVLILAHAAIGLPFVIMIVGAAYRQSDPTLERAARVCGAGPFRAFVTGVLPQLTPAIAAAGVFAFFISFDELVIALFLMGGAETLPVRLWNDLRFQINPTIASISTLLIVFSTVAMGAVEIIRQRAARKQEKA